MLIEAMITAALITVFVYGAIVKMPALNDYADSTLQKLQAVAVAKYETEKLFCKSIDELYDIQDQPIENMPDFYKTVSVENILNGKKVTVIVKYPKGMVSFVFERHYSPYEQ